MTPSHFACKNRSARNEIKIEVKNLMRTESGRAFGALMRFTGSTKVQSPLSLYMYMHIYICIYLYTDHANEMIINTFCLDKTCKKLTLALLNCISYNSQQVNA